MKNKYTYWGVKILCSLFYFVSFFLLSSLVFLNHYFGDVTAEQVFFHLVNALAEVNETLFYLFYQGCIQILGPTIIATFVICFLDILFPRKGDIHRCLKQFKNSKWNLLLSAVFLISMLCFCEHTIHFGQWIRNKNRPSLLYEKYFITADTAQVYFKQKKNVILIYMESMENSYHNSVFHGEDLAPNLKKLEDNNTYFIGHDQVVGTDFTAAGIFSGLCGSPLAVPFSPRKTDGYKYFPPKVKCIPQIFVDNGYSTHYLMGSSGAMGDIDHILKQSGIQNVTALFELRKQNLLKEKTWGDSSWGMKDSALFEIAKTRLLELGGKDQPFFYGISTIDTHYPGEFFDASYCKKKYGDFSDVVLCSDKIISEFVNWVEHQSFSKNTVIILIGDHLAPRNSCVSKITPSFHRSVINIFIHPAVEPVSKYRLFTSVDFAPTILAAAGGIVKKNAFGLGRNLFSDESTLYELFRTDFKRQLVDFRVYYRNIMLPKKEEKNNSSSKKVL